MRLFGALFLVVLLAAATALYLRGRGAVADLRGVAATASRLREEGVTGRPFDRAAASRATRALEEMAEDPGGLPDRVEELRAIADAAAGWARDAPVPSAELAAAVALRSAAGELREYALRRGGARLVAARRHIQEARAALAGEDVVNDPLAAVRQGLDNLQQSQEEPLLELDEDLAR